MPLYTLLCVVVVYLHLHEIKTNERREHKIQTVQVRLEKPHRSSKINPAGENDTFKEKAEPANTENNRNVC